MSEAAGLVGDRTIHVVGAGSAGSAAAITAANAGARVVVHEREEHVGARFHGDWQGLENWTTRDDVVAELGAVGLVPGCEVTPFFEQTCFDPDGRESVARSQRPLFYLLRRGPGPGTLDAGLLGQARSGGVEVRFSDRVDHLPEGGIIATGPRAADAIAVGYLFGTDRADGAFFAFDNRLAPGGYAYLLVHNGRATLAMCLFSDFHNERTYLERTVAFFRDRFGLTMSEPRRFSGFGDFDLPATAVRGKFLLAGEAVGFQDMLWGFGMRHALLSGQLAALALVPGKPETYDRLWRRRLGGQIRTALVNRLILERLGDRGYRWLRSCAVRASSADKWLCRQYSPSWAKTAVLPVARHGAHGHRRQDECPDPTCDCTWCRCQHGNMRKEGQ